MIPLASIRHRLAIHRAIAQPVRADKWARRGRFCGESGIPLAVELWSDAGEDCGAGREPVAEELGKFVDEQLGICHEVGITDFQQFDARAGGKGLADLLAVLFHGHGHPQVVKAELNRELSAWEGRLERFLARGTLVRVDVSWDKVVAAALGLSREQTLRFGTRSYDIIHVAMAAELHCRDFITCDLRQAKLARTAGMKVTEI